MNTKAPASPPPTEVTIYVTRARMSREDTRKTGWRASVRADGLGGFTDHIRESAIALARAAARVNGWKVTKIDDPSRHRENA